MSETPPRYDIRPAYRVDLHLNPRGAVRPPLRSIECHASSPIEAGFLAVSSLRDTMRKARKAWIAVYRLTVVDAVTGDVLLDCPEAFRI